MAAAFKVGDRVRYEGVGTDWMPVREGGYLGTVTKVFANGKLAVRLDGCRDGKAGGRLRKSTAYGTFNLEPSDLTPV